MIALNLQHASASRTERQVEWLVNQLNGDVLVLSEVAAGRRSKHLVDLLTAAGFTATYDEAGSGNQVVVAVRSALVSESIRVLHRSARFVHITAAVRDVELEVVGLYVPSRGPAGQRNVAKRSFQHEVATALPPIAEGARRRGRGLLVAGDLNVVERGHVPAHRVFGQWEYSFYDSFAEKCGLRDAFRTHNLEAWDHSWFGRRSGLGYRIDHMFYSPPLRVHTCRYDHFPRNAGLSDHAALTARLLLPDGARS